MIIREWTRTLVGSLKALLRRLDLVAFGLSVLAAFGFTIIAAGVVFLLPLNSANRDVAIGSAFGLGIFMLAFIAGVAAVFAYDQSSRRPKLTTRWSFVSLRDRSEFRSEFARNPGVRDGFSGRLSDTVVVSDLVPLEPVTLKVQIVNDGEVAARYVTVVFFLEGIYFSPFPSLDPGSLWNVLPDEKGSRIQWEGGTSALIYKALARGPAVDLTGMWALPHIKGVVVTVADGLKDPEVQHFEMKGPSPTAAAAAVVPAPGEPSR